MGKPVKNLSQSGEIAAYIRAHPQYRNIVVLLSGHISHIHLCLGKTILQKFTAYTSNALRPVGKSKYLSMALQFARQALEGTVYAIEKKTEALELLKKNKLKHRVSNLEIVPGEAPQMFENLSPPTHALIGGSGSPRFSHKSRPDVPDSDGIRKIRQIYVSDCPSWYIHSISVHLLYLP